MFRLTTRVRALSRPLLQQSAGRAAYHEQAKLEYPIEEGLEPFLSAQSLDFLYNMRQKELIGSVNRLTGGTDFEGKTLYNVVYDSASDPTRRPLTNYSSQAWNMDFFFKSLTPKSVAPGASVKRELAGGFKSFERFQSAFDGCALSMFGNGWTWLVVDENGRQSVMNTYNGTTPFTAYPSSGGALAKGMSFSTINRRKGSRPFFHLMPILGLSMWQEAYLPDYGLDRRSYVENFWKVVDWSLVEQRLMSVLSTAPRM
ncbi:hypothetical protein GGF46_005524 [Coemansia sp. RSA 552]|nr:hypothetical protein GGF46_005524 [Coemansia sp. RSA 552]